MWSQIGVKVKVNAHAAAQLLPEAEKLDVSMYMLGWGGSITDAETTLTPILRSRGESGRGLLQLGQRQEPEARRTGHRVQQEPEPPSATADQGALREHNDRCTTSAAPAGDPVGGTQQRRAWCTAPTTGSSGSG
jgi:peptide/nickel transport system substrate-binding protein